MLKHFSTILLAITLASLVWTAAVREQYQLRTDDYSRAIPLTVAPPATTLAVVGDLPDSVRVRLRAPQDSWSALRLSDFQAILDLASLPEGRHDIDIQLSVADNYIEIAELEPQSVMVHIQSVQTISLPITVNLLDTPALGYINRKPVVEPEQVLVTAPTSVLDRLTKATVNVSMRGAKETLQRTAPVILGDDSETILTHWSSDPARVEVTVPIEQRFGYKDVSVSVAVDGELKDGYWISNISVDPSAVTLFGHPTTLNEITGFIETTAVNVSQATSDVAQTVPLNLPDGVTVVVPQDEERGLTTAEVVVEIMAIEGGKTFQRPIKQQGLAPDLQWAASPGQVDIIVSGPIPHLSTLLPADIDVIVNLFELEPGVHKLTPDVFLPDDLTLSAILPDTIELTLEPLAEPQTPILTATSTITN